MNHHFYYNDIDMYFDVDATGIFADKFMLKDLADSEDTDTDDEDLGDHHDEGLGDTHDDEEPGTGELEKDAFEYFKDKYV